MLGAIQVGNIGHIAFKPFIANITKENLFLFTLLIGLNGSHIFFNIEVLLPADEHTLLLCSLSNRFLLVLALDSLFDFELFAAQFIVFCCYRTFCLCCLAHLLYIKYRIDWDEGGWSYFKNDHLKEGKMDVLERDYRVKCIFL